ncbi:polysaccharide deacetylase family protein [Litoribacter ruber]|uniref:Polysaccharide deacetylase family protein n=2 Tax=Litoribacter ruber TaxID=702568 RepID=A0AAP2G532_9BACT|nr:polysaccharide deacetylase family protein [Litoribacter alkaliphilus]MBT0811308.1 polysaccharide deacetylase family protein [Litoribacter ruber]
MFIHKVPRRLQKAFPQFIWRKNENTQKIYLTFDDGPVPQATDAVLEVLDKFEAKATFFMVGDNVDKNPALAREVLSQGHTIGNHTYNHLNGLWCTTPKYLKNVRQGKAVLEDVLGQEIRFFRPPYGKIKKGQWKAVGQFHEIVMWDVLSGDYSPSLSVENSILKTVKYSQNGSVLVFHDQEKTVKKAPYILEQVLYRLSDKGFEFDRL